MLKNGKDLSNRAPKIKMINNTKKTHFFPVFAKTFPKLWMKLTFFCQFPNLWALRVSGMGCYTSTCEKFKIIAPQCYMYSVTRATQNEALLWKIAILEMEKPSVGAGTFCPLPILLTLSRRRVALPPLNFGDF